MLLSITFTSQAFDIEETRWDEVRPSQWSNCSNYKPLGMNHMNYKRATEHLNGWTLYFFFKLKGYSYKRD